MESIIESLEWKLRWASPAPYNPLISFEFLFENGKFNEINELLAWLGPKGTLREEKTKRNWKLSWVFDRDVFPAAAKWENWRGLTVLWVGYGRRQRQGNQPKEQTSPRHFVFSFHSSPFIEETEINWEMNWKRGLRQTKQRKKEMSRANWLISLWVMAAGPLAARQHIPSIHPFIDSIVPLACSAEKRRAHASLPPQKRGNPTLSLLLDGKREAKRMLNSKDNWFD